MSLPAEHLSDLLLGVFVWKVTVKIQGYKHLNGSQEVKFLFACSNYRGLHFIYQFSTINHSENLHPFKRKPDPPPKKKKQKRKKKRIGNH